MVYSYVFLRDDPPDGYPHRWNRDECQSHTGAERERSAEAPINLIAGVSAGVVDAVGALRAPFHYPSAAVIHFFPFLVFFLVFTSLLLY